MFELAKICQDQGSAPFYGCSKCRCSRRGCIWWQCNPAKFEAHYAKFPEKYVPGTKKLKLVAEKDLKVEEPQGLPGAAVDKEDKKKKPSEGPGADV